MVRYTIHDGELVSLPWKTVLVAMERDVGDNNVNEGHRTFERQQYFWNCYQCKCCNDGNLAAYPNSNAPHIRSGRIDHAIDFEDGAKAQNWLNAHGIRAYRPVPGESWHVEVNAADLQLFHDRHSRDKWDTLPKHVEFAVRRLFMHRNQARDEAKSGKGPAYRKQVRYRTFWRNRVEGFLKRARRASTKRLLREALRANVRK